VRLSNTTQIEKVLEICKHWRIDVHKQSLVISIYGGAKGFNLDQNKQEIFHRGLIKAAYDSKALIITAALYTGVVRALGQAIKAGVCAFDCRFY
jgi:hypothetical protein